MRATPNYMRNKFSGSFAPRPPSPILRNWSLTLKVKYLQGKKQIFQKPVFIHSLETFCRSERALIRSVCAWPPRCRLGCNVGQQSRTLGTGQAWLSARQRDLHLQGSAGFRGGRTSVVPWAGSRFPQQLAWALRRLPPAMGGQRRTPRSPPPNPFPSSAEVGPRG